MKKLLIILLIISLSAGMCACKSRTPASSASEKPKGARENVVVPENPKTAENAIQSSSVPETDSESEENPKEAEDAAKEFLKAVQSGSKEKIQRHADYNKLLRITQEQNAEWQFSQILPHMTWELISSEIDGDGAVVSVKISNIDMGVILPAWFENAMRAEYDNALSDEPLDREGLDAKIKDDFARLLDGHNDGRVEKIVDIRMEKSSGEWKPKPDDNLGDALLGRYFSAYSGVAGNMMQQGGQPQEIPQEDESGTDTTDEGEEIPEE